MTGAGVLTTGGAVVVGSVARSVVVVVVALEERVVRRTVGETAADAHTTAAVAISDEGVPPFESLPNDTVMGLPSESQPSIGSLHQFFPILYSFWSRAENEFSADWSVSSPMALGKTLTFAMQRLIYISIIGLSVKRSPMKVAIKSTPSVLSLIVLKISL